MSCEPDLLPSPNTTLSCDNFVTCCPPDACTYVCTLLEIYFCKVSFILFCTCISVGLLLIHAWGVVQ